VVPSDSPSEVAWNGLCCPHAKSLWCSLDFSLYFLNHYMHCPLILRNLQFPMYTPDYFSRMVVVVHLLILMGTLLGWMTIMIKKGLDMCKEIKLLNVWMMFGYSMLSRLGSFNHTCFCSVHKKSIIWMMYTLWWDHCILQSGGNKKILFAKLFQCFEAPSRRWAKNNHSLMLLNYAPTCYSSPFSISDARSVYVW
jgi:hypothetical protein